jgi:spermidine/putrescine-binding protein
VPVPVRALPGVPQEFQSFLAYNGWQQSPPQIKMLFDVFDEDNRSGSLPPLTQTTSIAYSVDKAQAAHPQPPRSSSEASGVLTLTHTLPCVVRA